jgi:hypothetical protein
VGAHVPAVAVTTELEAGTGMVCGSAAVKDDGTVLSLSPSKLILIAAPRVVHVSSAPTSGERKKFSAARTVVVEAPPSAVIERYPATGADAEIDV